VLRDSTAASVQASGQRLLAEAQAKHHWIVKELCRPAWQWSVAVRPDKHTTLWIFSNDAGLQLPLYMVVALDLSCRFRSWLA